MNHSKFRAKGRRFLSAALAFCLLCAGCPFSYAGSFEGYEESDRRPLSETDLSYSGYDAEGFEAAVKLFAELAGKQSDEKLLTQAYSDMLDAYDELGTQYALAMWEADRDIYDEKAGEAFSEVYAYYFNAGYDMFWKTLQDSLSGPMESAVRAQMSQRQQEWADTYADYGDELSGLSMQELALVDEYGENMVYDWSPSVLEKNNRDMGAVYLELVDIRDRIAEINGYDSYYEYSFDSYGRDYTPEDLETLYAQVKDGFFDACLRINELLDESGLSDEAFDFASQEETLDAACGIIAGVSPHMQDNLDYLRANKLYDLEDYEGKYSGGYTMGLNSYDAAYIFNSPEGGFFDLKTIIHEFGHFNAYLARPQRAAYETSNLDVAEIQSQALELLSMENYSDVLPAHAREYAELYILADMLDTICIGAAVDEFEKAVYSDTDMTLEELNARFGEILDEYGIDGRYWDDMDWIMISHIIESPCYYIAYCTSALASLELWSAGLDDREDAVDRYLLMSAIDPEYGYLEALEACGIRAFTESGALGALKDRVLSYTSSLYGEDGAAPGTEGTEGGGTAETGVSVFPFEDVLGKAVAAAALIMAISIAVVALLWKSHKGPEIASAPEDKEIYTTAKAFESSAPVPAADDVPPCADPREGSAETGGGVPTCAKAEEGAGSTEEKC